MYNYTFVLKNKTKNRTPKTFAQFYISYSRVIEL